jgi:RNA polymerase sigma-70 factor (ECF subfamily)
MTTTTLPNAPFDDEHFETVYAQYFDRLVRLSISKFNVPDADAESLAHDVLMTYLRKQHQIIDLHQYLVGAICNASRYFWRRAANTYNGHEEYELDRPDPSSERILDSLPDQLAAREALECLPPRYREILQMRYFEGCTVSEVAKRLGVKPRYAQKLIGKCLRRAELLYTEKGKAQSQPAAETKTPKKERDR